ncbi:hypothetical protein BDV12DRAFT_177904 [Aspergillus spectabilis]
MSTYEDEDYFIPLEDQRVFGAGIARKRVPFVRSSDHELSTLTSSAPSTPSGTGASIANTYLSIVMPKSTSSTATASSISPETSSISPTNLNTVIPEDRSHSAPPPTSTSTSPTCEICNLPLASSKGESQLHKQHESSLAHQVCLTHSHPPSHLDRTRHGLRYLESYGWDPDSRLGLGIAGREGIRDPLKGKLKSNTVGLGAVLPAPAEKRKKVKVQKLNAKQVRKGHFEARRKGEKLREMFHMDEDVLRYLGAG